MLAVGIHVEKANINYKPRVRDSSVPHQSMATGFPFDSHLFKPSFMKQAIPYKEVDHVQEYTDVTKFVTSEEQELRQRLYSQLRCINKLKDKDVLIFAETAIQLSQVNLTNAQRVYNVLQYLLERETTHDGRIRIIELLHRIVLMEHWKMIMSPSREPRYIPVISANIRFISHATDKYHLGGVRHFLHQCMAAWIELGVFSSHSLTALQKEELQWTFQMPRPIHEVAENSADVLDLVFLGISGKGLETAPNMSAVVSQGIWEGQKDGWITKSSDGRLTVKCS